jgi:hypothetical protein
MMTDTSKSPLEQAERRVMDTRKVLDDAKERLRLAREAVERAVKESARAISEYALLKQG